MQCKACFHPRRTEIDADLISGVPVRTIVAYSGLSLGGITRHKEHVVEIIKPMGMSERSEHGTNLLNRVEKVLEEAQAILTSAKSKEDFKSAVAALNSITRALELLGRASGELSPNGASIHLHQTRISNTTVNVEAGSDRELAMLVSEATRGYDPVEISRLKAICEASI